MTAPLPPGNQWSRPSWPPTNQVSIPPEFQGSFFVPTQETPTVLQPRHSKNGRDRFYEWWVRYRAGVKRTVVFVIILILFGMVVTKPPRAVTDSCQGVRFELTKPTDVNSDGFIDCRSDQELGVSK